MCRSFHHNAQVVQLAARTHIILLLQFSQTIADSILTELQACILGSHTPQGPKSSSWRQEGSLQGPLEADLLAKFGLQVLAAALAGLPAASLRAMTIKQFLWGLLTPNCKDFLVFRGREQKPSIVLASELCSILIVCRFQVSC